MAGIVAILLLVGIGKPFALWHQSGSVESAAQNTVVTVAPTQPGLRFDSHAIGLSLESEELATNGLSGRHKSLVRLMRALGPGVLRVGGNSLDYSWWSGGREQAPGWATSVVSASDLVRLDGLLATTGWRVILGLDLGHFDPARAAREARAAKRIFGARLLGFEIGNEPNDYASPLVNLRPGAYGPSDYLRELGIYRAALQITAPGIPLFGPDLGSPALQRWLSVIVSEKSTPFTALTEHYYPTTFSFSKGTCKGTAVPSADELLSPEVREREDTALHTFIEAGKLVNRETRITETNNTSSCDAPGGPATSPVFASALWSLDWVLRAASAGVAGLNFHGRFGRCLPEAYTPICAPGAAAAARGHEIARPEYYGLLAARQLEGGRFVPVQISGQSTADLTAYATVHAGGALTLAVDNLSAEDPASLLVEVPGYRTATAAPLLGSSVRATSGVTFGHTSFNGAKTPRLTRTRVPKTGGGFTIELAGASAVVVTLHR